MIVLPYVQVNGDWTISTDALCMIYERLDARWTFADGSVRCNGDFIDHMQNPRVFPIVVGGDGEPVALGWLTDVAENRAFVHFAMLAQGRKIYEAAHEGIRYWWRFADVGGPELDVLLGLTPSNNYKALKFIERLGFRVVGEIPGMLKDAYAGERVGAVISYLEREKWAAANDLIPAA